jgi:LysR family glycine cleavage system transcriptional activator
MVPVTHLKSLQALELAIRAGSLTAAAERLGITAAAVGQRIRSLEDYLGTDLLLRGRSGLQPTAELEFAIEDLRVGFAALERASQALDFQRTSEIHIVADPDWADLWLAPRLAEFREAHPRIRFCVNGTGDVPVRLGTPDMRVLCTPGPGEALFTDILLPVTGPDNLRRIADRDPEEQLEGMPLLHLKSQRERAEGSGWVAWCARFGHRRTGTDRGVHYGLARHALEAARLNAGFLLCGLSLVLPDIAAGRVVCPFPMARHLRAPHPFRMQLRADAEKRPQVQRFAAWLRGTAQDTRRQIEALAGPGP